MNTRAAIEGYSATNVLSVSFNADQSCFAVGLNSGFKIFVADWEKSCQLKAGRDFPGGVQLVEMMGRANVVAIVGRGQKTKYPPYKVVLWNVKKHKPIVEITVPNTVRGIQLTKTHLAVALQNGVRLYALKQALDSEGRANLVGADLVAAYETAANMLGLCCLNDDLIAFPGRTAGQLQIVHLATESVSIIPAYPSGDRLQAMALSRDGELIATASYLDTLLRVFSTSSCATITEVRRGIDPASIFSLSFSPSGKILGCTSDKGTFHVFDVGEPAAASSSSAHTGSAPSSPSGNKTKYGFLGKIPLMPRFLSDKYSFAKASFQVVEAGDNSSKPTQGVIGWLDDDTPVVVGAGRGARFERYRIITTQDGKRELVTNGWLRYLESPQ